MQKAVFLDRDGTLNPDEQGYINEPEDFSLYPFAGEAIRRLNELDFLVFIVTNQSGIARGYLTEADLHRIHQRMIAELRKEDAEITRIFYSPYHQEGKVEPFNIAHQDRKPDLGMFQRAKQEFDFSTRHSYLIGDKYSDIAFGRKAGLKTILVQTGNGRKEFMQNRYNWKWKPHFVTEHLLHAVYLIEKLENK